MAEEVLGNVRVIDRRVYDRLRYIEGLVGISRSEYPLVFKLVTDTEIFDPIDQLKYRWYGRSA